MTRGNGGNGREIVAGRPKQCRPQTALFPPSEETGSQHVGPVVGRLLRQQPNPKLHRQRRRLRERAPSALWQQLTIGLRGRGLHFRRRGPSSSPTSQRAHGQGRLLAALHRTAVPTDRCWTIALEAVFPSRVHHEHRGGGGGGAQNPRQGAPPRLLPRPRWQ